MWLLILAFYIVVAGFTYNIALKIQEKKKRSQYDTLGAGEEAGVMAVFWPFTLLLLIGNVLADKLFKP